MGPLHHLDLVVGSMERSLPFYRELLRPLGYVHEGPITGERGEPVVYLGHASHDASIGLRAAQSHAHPTPYDRYAVGVHHIAFRATARWLVDERAAWLREQGVEIESGRATTTTSPATTPSSSTTPTASSSRSSTSRTTPTSPPRSATSPSVSRGSRGR